MFDHQPIHNVQWGFQQNEAQWADPTHPEKRFGKPQVKLIAFICQQDGQISNGSLLQARTKVLHAVPTKCRLQGSTKCTVNFCTACN